MKRIWYIPGAISLVLLLPVCLAYMDRKDVFTEYRSITLAYPPIVSPADTSWLGFKWEEPKREWLELHCDGPLASSKKAIEEFSRNSRAISSARDTLHGVRLNFEAKTKWSTAIAAVDSAMSDTSSIFWLDDRSIRICWVPPPMPDTTYRPSLDCEVFYLKPQPPSNMERIMAVLQPKFDGLLTYWPVVSLLLVLATLSIMKLRQA